MREEQTYTREYVTGLAEFERLARDPAFLDFVGLIHDEGALDHHLGTLTVSTSEPDDAALASHWLRRLSGGRVGYALDIEAGDDIVELVRFWSRRLGVSHERLRLRHRRFAHARFGALELAPHGSVTLRASDPILRIRMQAWIDKARANLVRAGR